MCKCVRVKKVFSLSYMQLWLICFIPRTRSSNKNTTQKTLMILEECLNEFWLITYSASSCDNVLKWHYPSLVNTSLKRKEWKKGVQVNRRLRMPFECVDAQSSARDQVTENRRALFSLERKRGRWKVSSEVNPHLISGLCFSTEISQPTV